MSGFSGHVSGFSNNEEVAVGNIRFASVVTSDHAGFCEGDHIELLHKENSQDLPHWYPGRIIQCKVSGLSVY